MKTWLGGGQQLQQQTRMSN